MSTPARTLSGEPIAGLVEFDDPPDDPLALLRDWLDRADRLGVREPRALVLATVDGEGRVSSRTLLLKAVDDRGLLFGSSRSSRTGTEVSANPQAAGTLYWRETLQQVNVAGTVHALDDATSDGLFAGRERQARAVAHLSRQSRPLADEAALRAAVDELVGSPDPLERPPDWSAYRFEVARIEFWSGSTDRLHRRLEYRRQDGTWNAVRLQP